MADKADELIKQLTDDNTNARIKATKALGRKKDVRAVGSLIAKLRDKDGDVRRAAAEALGKIGDTRAEGPLIEALSEEWLVRRAAAVALGMIGNTRAVEPLIEALRYTDGTVRKAAAEALGKIADARAVEPLIAALKNEHMFVLARIAEGLGEIKYAAQSPVKRLIEALRDEWLVRRAAARALSNIGKDSVNLLIVALVDNTFQSKRHAAAALVKIGDTRIQTLVASYPHLFCAKCLKRPYKGNAKAGLFKYYEYVICNVCKSSLHLVFAEKVVGVIGAAANTCEVDGQRVYVSLWDETEKKARNADIDVLEIRKAEGINYEWAIRAVLNALVNDTSRPREYVRKIAVIVQQGVDLHEGEMMLLKNEFGGLSRG